MIVILAYVLGKWAAMRESKYVFVGMTILFIFVKMFVGVALVIHYVDTEAPDDKLFVIPFLVNYLMFTIFEIYVLDKLGHIRVPEKAH